MEMGNTLGICQAAAVPKEISTLLLKPKNEEMKIHSIVTGISFLHGRKLVVTYTGAWKLTLRNTWNEYLTSLDTRYS